MERDILAEEVYRAAYLKGKFTLRSGKETDEYFDKYLFEASPSLLVEIATHMLVFIPIGTDSIAGLEMGGIPLVTVMSSISGIPSRFVRKEAKGHGTRNLCEGGPIKGQRVVIIEDVVTSGGQVVLSANELRKRGAIVEDVICVIDREQGGAEAMRQAGMHFFPLFTMAELKQAKV